MKNFPFPVTIRVLNGWIEVSVPDFKIVKAKRRFEEVSTAEEIGILVLEVMKEAQIKKESLSYQKKPLPSPSKPRGAFEIEVLEKDLLTTRQVQEILKVSHETVRRLTNQGELPCVKTSGGHRRFLRWEIEKFLQRCPQTTRRKFRTFQSQYG